MSRGRIEGVLSFKGALSLPHWSRNRHMQQTHVFIVRFFRTSVLQGSLQAEAWPSTMDSATSTAGRPVKRNPSSLFAREASVRFALPLKATRRSNTTPLRWKALPQALGPTRTPISEKGRKHNYSAHCTSGRHFAFSLGQRPCSSLTCVAPALLPTVVFPKRGEAQLPRGLC